METTRSFGERLDRHCMRIPPYGGSNTSLPSTPSSSQPPPHHQLQHLRPLVINRCSSSDTRLDQLPKRDAGSSRQQQLQQRQRPPTFVCESRRSHDSVVMPPCGTPVRAAGQPVRTTGGGGDAERDRDSSLDEDPREYDDDGVGDDDDDDGGGCPTTPGRLNAGNRAELDRSEVSLESSMSYVDKIIDELIETERSYVKDMKDIVQGYMPYVKGRSASKEWEQDCCFVFGNICDIYRFNGQFLLLLEKNQMDPVKIAECFLQKHDGFIIYSDYCTNFPRSVEVLERWMKDATTLSALRYQQKNLNHPLPLSTYLFKPVQRILKYHLLLKSILSNHSPDECGHDVVESALQRMIEVAMRINEIKRQHERAMRAQEIRGALTGCHFDNMTFGDLVLEDVFRTIGGWSDRHVNVFLFRKLLLITKKRKDGQLHVKAVIKTSKLMLIESIVREPLQFHLLEYDISKVSKTRYILQAKSVEQKMLWCQEIKRVMVESCDVQIPERAKQVVLGTVPTTDTCRSDTKNKVSHSPQKQNSTISAIAERRARRRSTGALAKRRDKELASVTSMVEPEKSTPSRMEPQRKPGIGETGNSQVTPLSTRRAESPSPTREWLPKNLSCEEDRGRSVERVVPINNRRSQSLDSVCEASDESVFEDKITDRLQRKVAKGVGDDVSYNSESNHSGDTNDETEYESEDTVPCMAYGNGIERSASACYKRSDSNIRVVPIKRADSFKEAMKSGPIITHLPEYTRTFSDPSKLMRDNSTESRSSWVMPDLRSLEEIFDEWFSDSLGRTYELPLQSVSRPRVQSDSVQAKNSGSSTPVESSVVMRRKSSSSNSSSQSQLSSPLLTPEFRNKRLTRLFNNIWEMPSMNRTSSHRESTASTNENRESRNSDLFMDEPLADFGREWIFRPLATDSEMLESTKVNVDSPARQPCGSVRQSMSTGDLLADRTDAEHGDTDSLSSYAPLMTGSSGTLDVDNFSTKLCMSESENTNLSDSLPKDIPNRPNVKEIKVITVEHDRNDKGLPSQMFNGHPESLLSSDGSIADRWLSERLPVGFLTRLSPAFGDTSRSTVNEKDSSPEGRRIRIIPISHTVPVKPSDDTAVADNNNSRQSRVIPITVELSTGNTVSINGSSNTDTSQPYNMSKIEVPVMTIQRSRSLESSRNEMKDVPSSGQAENGSDMCREQRSLEKLTNDDDVEVKLKRVLLEMTVSHLPIREAVRRYNVTNSRSLESLESSRQRELEGNTTDNHQHSVLSSSISAGLPESFCTGSFALSSAGSSPGPVSGDLIRKRVHMFENEPNDNSS